mgnify:CR=1 FL=1
MALGSISNFDSKSSIISLYETLSSFEFITTVTIVPSSFWKDVLWIVVLLAEVLIRTAPGFINLEKWPI